MCPAPNNRRGTPVAEVIASWVGNPRNWYPEARQVGSPGPTGRATCALRSGSYERLRAMTSPISTGVKIAPITMAKIARPRPYDSGR